MGWQPLPPKQSAQWGQDAQNATPLGEDAFPKYAPPLSMGLLPFTHIHTAENQKQTTTANFEYTQIGS